MNKFTPIEILHLSNRTLNALINNDILLIEQLISKTERELLALKGIGVAVLQEIKEKLVKNELKLASNM